MLEMGHAHDFFPNHANLFDGNYDKSGGYYMTEGSEEYGSNDDENDDV